MKGSIEKIQTVIAPLREQIINHKVYAVIENLEDLKVFMEYHVYAVWDFMSLLKSLQINLTCTNVPWFPVGSGSTRALINEIVAGEESDVDVNGDKKSHFEMYLDAMHQCGADTNQIGHFIQNLKETGDFELAYTLAQTPIEARNFVDYTFKIINGGEAHLQASTFTFGREDLIPNMFLTIVNDLNRKFPEQISLFKYYLDRHIEVDGDHHSHLALAMTSELCGQNQSHWETATAATIASLERRIELWDGAYNKICAAKLEQSDI